MQALIEKIKQFDDLTLRDIAGPSVVKAVSDSYSTGLKSVLAEIICLEFGTSILGESKIRSNIIDIADESSIKDLAQIAGLPFTGHAITADKLQRHFSIFSVERSKEFAQWMGLGEEYNATLVQDNRANHETIKINYGQEVELKGYLHDYQKNIKDQIRVNIRAPGSRAMVHMPTGAGKTYTALEVIVDQLRQPFFNNFIVWIVNTNELAEQALQSFKSLWEIKGDREIDCFRLWNRFTPKFEDYPNGGVVFASYDLMSSILKKRENKHYRQIEHLANRTNYLIVDEAHGAVAETYSDCIHFFIGDRTTQLLGLTATPDREDDASDNELSRLFDKVFISIRDSDNRQISDPIRYLQDREYLAKLNIKTLESNVICLEKTEDQILKALAIDARRNELILNQIQTAVDEGDQTLVFACTKDHVIALFILCKRAGINVSFIIGNVSQTERLSILEDFKSKKINVLINLEILSTGIDIPALNRLIVTRPVKSAILYSQMVGRALRGPKNGGNKYNTIINVLDNLDFFPDISLLYNSFSAAWDKTNDTIL
jgi:DNA repair protein RadD